MKYTKTFPCLLLLLLFHSAFAQTGPWAHYEQELKDGALYREASAGNLDEVKSIVAGGGNVKVQLKQTLGTPLMAAAGSGKIEVVRYLLDQGADPTAKDWWGQTATDKARAAGAANIVQLLNTYKKGGQPEPDKKQTKQDEKKDVIKPDNGKPAGKPTAWPLFGSLQVGDSVLYMVSSHWYRGVIKEVGITKPTGRVSQDFSERKYLIDPDAYALGDEWAEWTKVVKAVRQPFWTQWFIGEWQIGEVQAYHNEVKNSKETDTYYYMDATETLRINNDQTYRWKLPKGKVVTGRWIAAKDKPGVVLLKGVDGYDYTLTGYTSIDDWRIRKLDVIELRPSAMVLSSKGKRRTTL